jgi:hypothetical protein
VPATRDITIYRGDSFSLFVRIRSKVFNEMTNAFEPGPYQNLTGLTGRAHIRATAGPDGDLLAEITCTIPDQAVPENHGSVLLTMTPAQTAAINRAGVWDFQLENADRSDVRTYLRGRVTIEEEVTV